MMLNESLRDAAKQIAAGCYEANYGGGVIKKRIATKGRGKSGSGSGSVRTIVAFRQGKHCFFVYGFEKNMKSNISPNEEKAIKLVAKALFAYSDEELFRQIKNDALIEVDYE